MKNLYYLIALLFFGCSYSSNNTVSTVDYDMLFQPNGKWVIEGPANWDISKEEVRVKSDTGMSFILTERRFKDFELKLEFMPDSTINSGVYVRCGDGGTTPENCYELNIWDLHPNQEYRTGAVVFKAKPLEYVETLNQWNTYRVKCEGSRIQAWVNGYLTADLEDEDFPEGYIALQAAGKGEIRFRNVGVIEIKDSK